MPADTLTAYRAKRDFERTEEPPGDPGRSGSRLGFVIQKHAASHLHFDLRRPRNLRRWFSPQVRFSPHGPPTTGGSGGSAAELKSRRRIYDSSPAIPPPGRWLPT